MFRWRNRLLFTALLGFGLSLVGCIEQVPAPAPAPAPVPGPCPGPGPCPYRETVSAPIYGDHNFKELVGDGHSVTVNGQKYFLSRKAPPAAEQERRKEMFRQEMQGHRRSGVMFHQKMDVIPRSEWSQRIKEQAAARARVSDYCNFPAFNQASTNYCWANGPCQAFTIARLQQGLPPRRISSASIACLLTDYRNVGGWELDAIEGLTDIGATTEDAWPNAAISKAYNTAAVENDRENYVALEWVELNSFDEFATALLNGYPCAVAYNWWHHVVILCDLVEISPGHFGFLIRNSWSDGWGGKNELGFGGFAVLAEGKGTPSSGFMLRQVRASARPVVRNASLFSSEPNEGEPYQAEDGSWHVILNGYHCWRENGEWVTTINGRKRFFRNGHWYEMDRRGFRRVSFFEGDEASSPINPVSLLCPSCN